jgi:2-dehydropantoate 2-reductase
MTSGGALMSALPPVVILGAGAVGCYVGGRLRAQGAQVHFVGRPRVIDALRAHGLRLTDLDGDDVTVPAETLSLHTAPPTGPAVALLCVKSGATAAAAAELATALPPGSVVLSLQNGVSNAAVAQAAAPQLTVLPGMVPFNVAELEPGHYHRGSVGSLAAQDHEILRQMRPVFDAAGLGLTLHADIRPVQWAKLLLNLNNPINALSGLPLRAQLMDRDHRFVLAALQQEALRALDAAAIRPARVTPVAPWLMPHVLRLPDPVFRIAAHRMLRMDDKARSSMADDVASGRPTEVDALCGEVVRLAADAGLTAVLNARMVALVNGHDAASPPYDGRRLRHELGLG